MLLGKSWDGGVTYEQEHVARLPEMILEFRYCLRSIPGQEWNRAEFEISTEVTRDATTTDDKI